MTDQQVLRYTQLCKRRMDILLHSGASWLPEYEAELKHRPGIKTGRSSHYRIIGFD